VENFLLFFIALLLCWTWTVLQFLKNLFEILLVLCRIGSAFDRGDGFCSNFDGVVEFLVVSDGIRSKGVVSENIVLRIGMSICVCCGSILITEMKEIQDGLILEGTIHV
jgi:hypothetical protein